MSTPTYTTHVGGGGWTPTLKKTSQNVNREADFLASEKFTAKRGGITIAAAKITADGNGNKIVKKGQLMVKLTSGTSVGKYAPFNSGGSEGEQTVTDDSVYLLETMNCRDGDVVCGGVIQGAVLKSRVTPSSTFAALQGRIIFE
jgi:hypothetical protein